MAVEQQDRDSYTGYLTTGHEWNGIKELNTPVPAGLFLSGHRGPVLCRLLGFDAGVALGRDLHQRLLGIDQRNVVTASLREAAADRSVWTKKIETESFAAVQSDPKLMAIVRETGHTLFGNNCAACHGQDAKGGPGFPNLTTSSWLWGGKPEDIFNTIRVGINSAHRCRRSGATTSCFRLSPASLWLARSRPSGCMKSAAASKPVDPCSGATSFWSGPTRVVRSCSPACCSAY